MKELKNIELLLQKLNDRMENLENNLEMTSKQSIENNNRITKLEESFVELTKISATLKTDRTTKNVDLEPVSYLV